MSRPRSVPPVALLLGSVAYLYNTFNHIAELPGATVLVDTNYGQLRGSKSTARNGKIFFEFLGIPYASPPVGELRFEVKIYSAKNIDKLGGISFGNIFIENIFFFIQGYLSF